MQLIETEYLNPLQEEKTYSIENTFPRRSEKENFRNEKYTL